MREGAPVQVMSRGGSVNRRFYHFKIHHADSQLTRRVAKDIPFVGGLRNRRNDNQRIAARRLIEMQSGGGNLVGRGEDLFAVAHADRDRFIGVRPVGFGGNHQIEFFR